MEFFKSKYIELYGKKVKNFNKKLMIILNDLNFNSD